MVTFSLILISLTTQIIKSTGSKIGHFIKLTFLVTLSIVRVITGVMLIKSENWIGFNFDSNAVIRRDRSGVEPNIDSIQIDIRRHTQDGVGTNVEYVGVRVQPDRVERVGETFVES